MIDLGRVPTRRLLENVTPILGAVLLFGCATKGPRVAAAPGSLDTVVVADTVVVESPFDPNPELERRITRLNLQLLERDALIEDLRRQRDLAILEVVRTMAKLQTVASRAEAASAVAEARVAVGALSESVAGMAPEVDQARRLLDLSTAEFDRQNYEGALYLATQAKTIAQADPARARADVSEARSLQVGEERFSLPLSLESVARSNVRAAPRLDSEVVVTVGRGTPMVGNSHSGEWIRVSLEDGREGWIFHTLVRVRKASEG